METTVFDAISRAEKGEGKGERVKILVSQELAKQEGKF